MRSAITPELGYLSLRSGAADTRAPIQFDTDAGPDRHWPLVGYDHFRKIAGIRQYQLIQIDREVMDVSLVTDSPGEAQETGLRDHIAAALGHPFELQFHYHEERDCHYPLRERASGSFARFAIQAVDPLR